MKASVVVPLAVIAGAALFVWAGCAAVIDLGSESDFRPADAATTPVVEQDAAVEAGPELTCGLARVQNEPCRLCIEERCCAENLACANDPACIAGVDCIQSCSGDSQCIVKCPLFRNPDAPTPLDVVVMCSQEKCGLCSPGPACQHLGECARHLADDVEGKLLRGEVKNVVLKLVEATCDEERRIIAAKAGNHPDCADK